MPNLLLDLDVDRVDLVDEGANSAAHIRLYKRKEQDIQMDYNEVISKMKPEHAELVTAEIAKAKQEVPKETADALTAATEALAKANETIKEQETKLKEAEEVAKAKPSTEPNMEDVIKSLDPAVQEIFKSMKAQKEAAEEAARIAQEAKEQEEAVAKAKEFKAIPVEEAKLVAVVKGASADVIEVLKAANAAIENAGDFTEVGKGKGTAGSTDAWTAIEKKADEIVKRDAVTKQKAISVAIKENPELYREYLNGGAK